MSRMSPEKKLLPLRKTVEAIDEKILALLGRRFKTTLQIQNIKRGLALPIHQQKRENVLMNKYLAEAKRRRLPIRLVKQLFLSIFSYSKKTGIIKGK